MSVLKKSNFDQNPVINLVFSNPINVKIKVLKLNLVLFFNGGPR
jgi:hypothetical protein